MIVVDNSVVINWLAGTGPQARSIDARLNGQRRYVPELIDVEAASAFRRMVGAGLLTAEAGAALLASLGSLDFKRMSHVPLMPRVWELRDNVTPYDAVYVALAESLDAPLLTCDARLAKSPGIRCAVELIS